MKIVYIHQYFCTPDEPGGTRSYWIARELVERGHSVTMITGKNKQQDKIEQKNIDGIDVIYIRNPYDNSFSVFKRLISFLSFMIRSTYVAFKQKETNLIYATSTPLTVGIPAMLIKRIKKIPFDFEVRDLWPEVPIQMGAIRNWLMIKLTRSLEVRIYKNARNIITLSPGMRDGVLKRGISEDNVFMIPNMSKSDKFYPRDVKASMMKQLKLKPGKFYVIHFGAIGIANGVEYIIHAARLLKNNGEIEFLFAGGGGQEKMIKNLSEKLDLKNVRFLGKFSMADISELVNIASCSIVSFADIPILRTNSPNKLFDSLSAGKPIIVNSCGWTKELVEENHCGAYVDPKKPEELAHLVESWYNAPGEIRKMSENSRELAEKKYDKSLLTIKVAKVLENKI